MEGAAQDEEEALIQRLVELQTVPPPAAAAAAAAKQAWYADAYAFLHCHGGEHWWCRHGDVTAGVQLCPCVRHCSVQAGVACTPQAECNTTRRRCTAAMLLHNGWQSV